MIVKGQRKKTSNIYRLGIEFFSFLSKIPSLLPKPAVSAKSSKLNIKQIFIIVFITIFVWTSVLAFYIYRNNTKEMVAEIATAAGLEGRQYKKNTLESLKKFTVAPYNWVMAHIQDNDVPELYFDIKFKHFQKILEKRQRALEQKILIQEKGDLVPAKIRYGERTVPVKLRLKGDFISHIKSKKLSFRIHVKGKDHVMGMRRFSIQNPKARRFETEILFFEALKKEGILAPRYFFADVTINGDHIGLMAVEEHFSKELLESQHRRESVILKFDESYFWQANDSIKKEGTGFGGAFDNFKNAPIKPFRYNKIKKSKKLLSDLQVATSLLRGFVDKSLTPSDVFDPLLMGRFLAVSDMWGAWHALRWHNLRFYFNPITARLEPVGFDADIDFTPPRVRADRDPVITQILENDLKIKLIYRETLERLLKDVNSGETYKWVKKISQENLEILHKEYPLLGEQKLNLQSEWAKDINKNYRSIMERYPKILFAYSMTSRKRPFLEIQNPLPYSVLVSNIEMLSSLNDQKINFKFKHPLSFPLELAPGVKGEMPTRKKIYFVKPDSTVDYYFRITAHANGEETQHLIKSEPYFSVARRTLNPNVDINHVLKVHKYLSLDQSTRRIFVKQGIWKVNKWLQIPEDYKLIISAGTTLMFKSSVGIIAKGPLKIEGTDTNPVTLKGQVSGEVEQSWQGILVLRANEPSSWTHTKILNTSGIKRKKWIVPAGVTFYESEVFLSNILFDGNVCEDALNIVRSKFELEGVTIKNAVSDGFDSDFSQGTVKDSKFENLGSRGGGDGVDTSGSRVTMINTAFKNISDKAVSVGERSTVDATQLLIENVGTGAVSKDDSMLNITNSEIKSARFAGLMSYSKKMEYGPASLNADNIIFGEMPVNALAQRKSRILLDNEPVKSIDLEVKELYSTIMKPGMK